VFFEVREKGLIELSSMAATAAAGGGAAGGRLYGLPASVEERVILGNGLGVHLLEDPQVAVGEHLALEGGVFRPLLPVRRVKHSHLGDSALAADG
jgi:hypothetical protein